MYFLKDIQAPMSTIDVYNDLCRRIVTVELEPGMKISENSMSAEYGVSRSVLRSAFVRLQQTNLIEVYPQRGTFVKKLDQEYIRSAAMIRYVVERDAVYDILQNHRDVQTLCSDLKKIISDMEADLADGSGTAISDFKTQNAEFHLRIIKECFPIHTLNLLYEIRVHLAQWTNVDVAYQNIEQDVINQNKEIAQAIETGHLQPALRRIKEHFEMLVSNGDLMRQVHPDYFNTKAE